MAFQSIFPLMLMAGAMTAGAAGRQGIRSLWGTKDTIEARSKRMREEYSRDWRLRYGYDEDAEAVYLAVAEKHKQKNGGIKNPTRIVPTFGSF